MSAPSMLVDSSLRNVGLGWRLAQAARRRLAMPVVVLLALAGAALGPGAACGSPQVRAAREPTRCTFQNIDLTFVASKYTNPTTDGEPRPVMVRVYQLKNDLRIRNADFEEVWKRDKQALGEDLVKVGEVPIYPYTRSELKFERDESAQFLVLVALFQQPRGRSWYTSFELPPPPGKGDCGADQASSASGAPGGAPSAACSDGNCAAKKGLPPQPKFVVWIDGNRIDTGEDHLDEVTDPERFQKATLSAPAEDSAGKGAK